MTDVRFDVPLYTTAQAARLVGMSPSTLSTWAHGYERRSPGRPPVKKGPVITALTTSEGGPTIPFVGLVEATVVQAFRRTQLPLQRIRRALDILAAQGELEHALASRRLYTDGAKLLYDYAREADDGQLRLLTVVESGQRVFHEVISQYLKRISFDSNAWAIALTVPVTEREILRIRPDIADGEPLFIRGGAPLSAVVSRYRAGEGVQAIARDYGTDPDDIAEAIGAIWPAAAAA